MAYGVIAIALGDGFISGVMNAATFNCCHNLHAENILLFMMYDDVPAQVASGAMATFQFLREVHGGV